MFVAEGMVGGLPKTCWANRLSRCVSRASQSRVLVPMSTPASAEQSLLRSSAHAVMRAIGLPTRLIAI